MGRSRRCAGRGSTGRPGSATFTGRWTRWRAWPALWSSLVAAVDFKRTLSCVLLVAKARCLAPRHASALGCPIPDALCTLTSPLPQPHIACICTHTAHTYKHTHKRPPPPHQGEGRAAAAADGDAQPKATTSDADSDEEGDGEGAGGEGGPKLTKKQRKALQLARIAELKQATSRPDVVEVWDVTAPDPHLLVYLKVW